MANGEEKYKFNYKLYEHEDLHSLDACTLDFVYIEEEENSNNNMEFSC